MEELVPDSDGQLDVEGGGEEGEEPVEGDQADLNVVEGEQLVQGWQVGCHLARVDCWGCGKGWLPRSEGPSDQPGLPRGWPSSRRLGADPENWTKPDERRFTLAGIYINLKIDGDYLT